jgi:hypothetical protein
MHPTKQFVGSTRSLGDLAATEVWVRDRLVAWSPVVVSDRAEEARLEALLIRAAEFLR